MRIPRKDQEDRALVKRLHLGQRLDIEAITGLSKVPLRLFDRKMKRHGWILKRDSENKTVEVVEK